MHEGLYEQLCSQQVLLQAWEKIKTKGSAGGIDRVSVEMFEDGLNSNINSLAEQLSSGHYIPEPYQEIKVPKDDGEHRCLSLPTIKDKIVQCAVKDLMEPLLEKQFLDVSYAYRPGKGTERAIARASHLIVTEKRQWATVCDIDNYFDTVDHALLLEMLSGPFAERDLVRLVSLWVKMGRVDQNGSWKPNETGIPQGGVISPLLANLYLHPFDLFMTLKRFGYIRYADDFIVLSETESEARRAFEEAGHFLTRRLRLKLNADANVRNVNEGFEFLGITFRGMDRTLSEKKKEEIRERIAQAIVFHEGASLKGLFDTLAGIERYYGQCISQQVLEELDEWVIDCLKDRLDEAYGSGLVRTKADAAALLRGIPFLSQKHSLYARRAEHEIVAHCRKRRRRCNNVLTEPSRDPVRKKKRQYQKLESEGFELLVTTPGVFLGKTKKGVTVMKGGVKKYEAPLLNLKNITVLADGVTLSSSVIRHCAEQDVPIFFMNFDGQPYARLAAYDAPSAAIGLAQLRAFENGKAMVVARSVVAGKIRNQANLVKYWHKYRKHCDEDYANSFSERIGLISQLAKEAHTVEAPDIETLRGRLLSIEGRASSAYWELVEKLLNDDIEFEGRVRKGATDLVNSVLNYGYGILYSRVWQAVSAAGLNPHISYLHTEQPGKPTLVFDMVEEFRQQAVDRAVFPLITKGEELKIEKGMLETETRRRVAERVLERLNTVETFRGSETRLSFIIRNQSTALADYLTGKSTEYRPYCAKW